MGFIWLPARCMLVGKSCLAALCLPKCPLMTNTPVPQNHMYKLLYIRQAKVASSSILAHFGPCFFDRTPFNEEPGETPDVQRLATALTDGYDATLHQQSIRLLAPAAATPTLWLDC